MGMNSGRARAARIRQAENGDYYISFRGGDVAIIETYRDEHKTLTGLLELAESEAQSPPQLADVKSAEAEMCEARVAAHQANMRLTLAERALHTAREELQDARRAASA